MKRLHFIEFCEVSKRFFKSVSMEVQSLGWRRCIGLFVVLQLHIDAVQVAKNDFCVVLPEIGQALRIFLLCNSITLDDAILNILSNDFLLQRDFIRNRSVFAKELSGHGKILPSRFQVCLYKVPKKQEKTAVHIIAKAI